MPLMIDTLAERLQARVHASGGLMELRNCYPAGGGPPVKMGVGLLPTAAGVRPLRVAVVAGQIEVAHNGYRPGAVALGSKLRDALPFLHEWGKRGAMAVMALHLRRTIWILPWQTVQALEPDDFLTSFSMRGAVALGRQFWPTEEELTSVAGWSPGRLRAVTETMRERWAEFDTIRQQPVEVRGPLLGSYEADRLWRAQIDAHAALVACRRHRWPERRELDRVLKPFRAWLAKSERDRLAKARRDRSA